MNPKRDTPAMKCLLLLLATGLAAADKLDRTYLPPLGAKYAGGSSDELRTPLEYPRETYPGTAQNNQPAPNNFEENRFTETPTELDREMAKSPVPIDYSTTIFPTDIGQNNAFPTSGFPPTSTETILYNAFPPAVPNFSYLPSKPVATVGQQTFVGSDSNPLFKTTSSSSPNRDFSNNEKSDNFYFVPVPQSFENSIPSQFPDGNIISNIAPNSGFIQYPNQVKNGYITSNKQIFTPNIATSNDVVQNYQPSVFGYYGGNPMIMTAQNPSPQQFENTELPSKFGEYDNNIPSISNTLENRISNERTTVKPFQTPLVRTNVKKPYKSGDSKPSSMPNYIKKNTINNTPVELNQRSNIPVISKFRPERPLAKSDRNAVILNYDNVITPEGFSYSFDTSNGIHADESGTAIGGVKAKGSYSYTGDDGKVYSVTYTADENGFQPRGDHLPTPPPIPEAIKKVIEEAAKNRVAGIIDDGSYDEKKYGYMNYQGAMDRYRPFKNKVFNVNIRIGNNVSRPNDIARRPNENTGFVPIASEKKNQNNQLVNNRLQSPVNNQEESSNGSPIQPNQSNASEEKNNLLKNTAPSDAKLKQINLNRPINLVNSYNQISKEGSPSSDSNGNNKFYQTQNPNINYISENTNTPNDNDSQGKLQTSTPGGVKLADDGYFYVPPLIKFNPVSDDLVNRNKTYITSDIPLQQNVDTTVTRRIDTNGNSNKPTNYGRVISTQTSSNEITTRKPYISGPNDHELNHYDDSQETIPVSNDGNQANVDNNDLDYTLYSSTTPMTSQTPKYEIQPASGYFYPNQYSQIATIPGIFDQNLPNVVENRVNLAPGAPGVRVSQDFVTTTYKPGLLNDGVLEVSQNVKIYGLGRPEPNSAEPFPSNVYNNKLYTKAIPSNEGSLIGAYPDNLYGKPAEATVQENINDGYGNDFSTKDGPIFDSAPIEGPTTPVFGPYLNSNFERQFKEETEFPMNPNATFNGFKNTKLTPEERTTPTVVTQNRTPAQEVIGENFSGPKQPQRFDPATGYYYK